MTSVGKVDFNSGRGDLMSGLRVLITNHTLAGRGGTELYLRDTAMELVKRGHTPIAYSSILGEVARELEAANIPVVICRAIGV